MDTEQAGQAFAQDEREEEPTVENLTRRVSQVSAAKEYFAERLDKAEKQLEGEVSRRVVAEGTSAKFQRKAETQKAHINRLSVSVATLKQMNKRLAREVARLREENYTLNLRNNDLRERVERGSGQEASGNAFSSHHTEEGGQGEVREKVRDALSTVQRKLRRQAAETLNDFIEQNGWGPDETSKHLFEFWERAKVTLPGTTMTDIMEYHDFPVITGENLPSDIVGFHCPRGHKHYYQFTKDGAVEVEREEHTRFIGQITLSNGSKETISGESAEEIAARLMDYSIQGKISAQEVEEVVNKLRDAGDFTKQVKWTK